MLDSPENSSFCVIPARGGSKGVPRKNIRLLNGIPLITYSIKSALSSGIFKEVYVSTEDREIAEIASDAGATIIERHLELAQDETPMPSVIEHAIKWYSVHKANTPKYVFLLQPTSPLRSEEDIRGAYEILTKEDCEAVMGVFKADKPPQWALTADENNFLRPLFPIKDYLARRQDLPPSYFGGPLFAFKTESFFRYKRFLMDKTRFYIIPRLRAIDIDTELDFRFAEFLLKSGREND